MKKEQLQHENEKLRREVEILNLKLEREEVLNSLERNKLRHHIHDLEKHQEKIEGSSAIGFDVSGDWYEDGDCPCEE